MDIHTYIHTYIVRPLKSLMRVPLTHPSDYYSIYTYTTHLCHHMTPCA